MARNKKAVPRWKQLWIVLRLWYGARPMYVIHEEKVSRSYLYRLKKKFPGIFGGELSWYERHPSPTRKYRIKKKLGGNLE